MDMVKQHFSFATHYVAFLFVFGSACSFAQTGPGGVGDSLIVKVWLDASSIGNLSDGTSIGIWPDRSGNNWHALQDHVINQPTYYKKQLNGQPIVRFDRSAAPQFLEIVQPQAGAALSSEHSIVVVSKPSLGTVESDFPEGNQLLFGSGLGKIQGVYYHGYPQMEGITNMQRLNGTGITATTYVTCEYAKSKYPWQRNIQVSQQLTANMIFTGYQNMTRKVSTRPSA